MNNRKMISFNKYFINQDLKQKQKRADKIKQLKTNISEFLFVVGLFGSLYLLLIIESI
jgi:hypothetical protein